MAPSIVGESLKGAELLAQVMQNELGYPCYPPPGSFRTDIIQAVKLGSRRKVNMCLYVLVCIVDKSEIDMRCGTVALFMYSVAIRGLATYTVCMSRNRIISDFYKCYATPHFS